MQQRTRLKGFAKAFGAVAGLRHYGLTRNDAASVLVTGTPYPLFAPRCYANRSCTVKAVLLIHTALASASSGSLSSGERNE